MGMDLNNYGLGQLAFYQFREGNKKLMDKGHNVEVNDQLLAVNGRRQEIVIVDKKDLTLMNKIKSLFGKGPLAHLDFDFFTVGKFVEKKVREIKTVEGRKNFQDLTFSEGSAQILENIYAIANRMKFVHSNWDSNLFDLVSKDVKEGIKIYHVPNAQIVNITKTNPGMNGRFLALFAKNQLEKNDIKTHFEEIKLSDKDLPVNKKGQLGYVEIEYAFTSNKAKPVALSDKVNQFSRLIIKM